MTKEARTLTEITDEIRLACKGAGYVDAACTFFVDPEMGFMLNVDLYYPTDRTASGKPHTMLSSSVMRQLLTQEANRSHWTLHEVRLIPDILRPS